VNLLQLRTFFISTYGKFNLVKDNVSYVDNGANEYINLALKYLESKYPQDSSVRVYKKDVAANTYRVDITLAKYISSVWWQTDSSFTQLEPIKYSKLLENYIKPITENNSGDVIYYCAVTNKLHPSQKSLTSANYTTQFTRGGSEILFSDQGDAEEYDSIILAPIPASNGTITIEGKFIEQLVDDTDICIWSVKYPLLVATVANMLYDGLRGGIDSMSRFVLAVDTLMKEFSKDRVNEEIRLFNQIGG